MSKRTIIKIDEDKCIGCTLCANRCEQGAIAMVDGKAKVVRDDYCDGFGNCLPVCPTGAISFSDVEVKNKVEPEKELAHQGGGCPGNRVATFNRNETTSVQTKIATEVPQSQLQQWPCQIQLVNPQAPFFENANLLIAADCAAFAYGNFHNEFMKNKITVIGCPKLDQVEYLEKLTDIITHNNIKSVTVVRMSVPCCGGIEYATIEALKNSGKMIPWNVVTISTDGKILES